MNAEKLNSANAIIKDIISNKKIEEKELNVIKKISKSANISGFRKGKVPTNVVKSRYVQEIQEESEKEAIQELLKLGMQELDIKQGDIIGDTKIIKFDKKDDGIEVELKIGIVPKVDVSNAKDCVPSFVLEGVSDDEVEKKLKDFAKGHGDFISSKDSSLAKGHFANIAFEGFLDGVPFDGGKSDDHLLEIGSNSFIPGFEDGLIGLKKSEEREIEVVFPENYKAKNLAGKPVKFKVLLKDIQERTAPEINDDLAKKFTYKEDATLQSLREDMKKQIHNEKKQALYDKDLKGKLVDKLLEKMQFDVPDNVLDQEIDMTFRNNLNKLTEEEIEQLRDNKDALAAKRETFRVEATKSVKITFIIDSLAKSLKLQVSDNEVIQAIYYESMMMGQDPKATVDYYQKNNLIPAVRMAILENKILTSMLDEKIVEKA